MINIFESELELAPQDTYNLSEIRDFENHLIGFITIKHLKCSNMRSILVK